MRACVNVLNQYIHKRVYKYRIDHFKSVVYTPIIRTKKCAVALRLREVEPRDNQK